MLGRFAGTGAGIGRYWFWLWYWFWFWNWFWLGDGAGAGVRIWRTDCDWRPNERPPPIGRANASPIIDSAVIASIIVTKNFFMLFTL
jgi:hypothetical protein